jgi:hypothetical protein
MATFYWVGGSGNWDATTTTNWASSSGGAGGAGVPTSTDDVVFDANSSGGGAFAVTVTGIVTAPAQCQDFTASSLSHVMTLTMGATSYLEPYGSMTLPASNLTWSGTIGSFLRFRATTTGKTITTNGVTITGSFIELNGSGGSWSLGSAYTSTSAFFVSQGSFDTANYNITCTVFQTTGLLPRSVTLGSSSLTLSGGTPISLLDSSILTFNAGTSSITCSAASPTFNGGSQTFYNVTFSSAAAGTLTINGDNTFNDLIFTSRSATGIRVITLGGSQTVNGVLTFGTGNTNIRKMQVGSNVVGTQRTFTANGTLSSLNDVSFRDIAAAGTVSTPWTGTRIGSGGNLSNITADAPKNVYRVGTGGWVANQWSLSSGGSVNLDNFPLPQDAIIFDNNTTSGTHTMDGIWWFGSLDCSAVTSAITIANSNFSPQWHGDMTLDSDITITATAGAWFFAKPSGSGAQVITPAGVTFAAGLTFASPASVQFAADITTDLIASLASGALDLNDYDLTCVAFNGSTANPGTRSIDFGTSSEINITGNDRTPLTFPNATDFTYSGTPIFNLTYSGSTGTRFLSLSNTNTGALETNAIIVNVTAGSDIVEIPLPANSDTRLVKTLNFTGFSGTFINNTLNVNLVGDLIISSGMTLSATNNAIGFVATSGTQEITTAGKTFDFPVTVNAPGATVQLQDALTMGSARTLTLTAGTLDSNDFDVTAGAFSSNNTNTRALDLGSSDWTLSGSGTVWDATDGTGLTVTPGTSSITLTSASAYTFAGGGKTYYDLNLDGGGDVTLLGNNTFNQVSSSQDDFTINFEAGSSTTVSTFDIDGTSGNLVSFRSTTPGSIWNILQSTGTLSVDYCDIKDANATGGATFQCSDGINSGNNTGWAFIDSKFESEEFFAFY